MQNTDINTMTPDELRTNLIDVCRVRDTLYAALDGKAHELAKLERAKQSWFKTARDNADERDAAQALVETHERTIAELWRALYDLASMLGVEEATVPPGSAPREVVALVQQDGTLPFEQVPAPVNPDAPADLSMRGGIEAFTEECAHHALTGE